MWSLAAVKHLVRKRAFRRVPKAIQSVAVKSWQIAPAETTIAPPAYFLPDQLKRITGWGGPDHPRGELEGGLRVEHAATVGYLLERAWLIDGTLYKSNACSFLQPRSNRWPRIRISLEIARAAVYCTPGGNRYFGQWLMDDCATYPLACAEGAPVTTDQPVNVHTLGYEDRLGMKPSRVGGAYLREAVVFDDFGQNRNKHARCRAMRERLLAGVDFRPHPGVFILRGQSGARRLLRDEWEIAERLRDKRGFCIVDPTKADVPSLISACAGAQTVAGVEGSGLIHGILLLPPGGRVLALQPPNRFMTLYKHLTDRDAQHFGFVVGTAENGDFRIDPDEVERTLDLFPRDG